MRVQLTETRPTSQITRDVLAEEAAFYDALVAALSPEGAEPSLMRLFAEYEEADNRRRCAARDFNESAGDNELGKMADSTEAAWRDARSRFMAALRLPSPEGQTAKFCPQPFCDIGVAHDKHNRELEPCFECGCTRREHRNGPITSHPFWAPRLDADPTSLSGSPGDEEAITAFINKWCPASDSAERTATWRANMRRELAALRGSRGETT